MCVPLSIPIHSLIDEATPTQTDEKEDHDANQLKEVVEVEIEKDDQKRQRTDKNYQESRLFEDKLIHEDGIPEYIDDIGVPLSTNSTDMANLTPFDEWVVNELGFPQYLDGFKKMGCGLLSLIRYRDKMLIPTDRVYVLVKSIERV